MGLFDFLKKKTTVQNSSISNSDTTNKQTFTYEAPKPSYVKKEVLDKTSKYEISVEQDGPPLLSDLIKSAIPSKQGLYPHELIMLEYAPTFKTSNNTFQQFWYYQYSITEPQALLDSLFARGFIEIGDLKSALQKLKLPEIKEELKLLNQKVSGKKDELISRLLENGDVDYLNSKFKERYYVLTEKGEQELKENQYVSYLHRNRYMSIWEMNQRIAQTHYPYRDILWGYFNEQSGVYFQNMDFGLYRCIRLNMHDFLYEEEKYKSALHLLVEVISYDLSGLGNNYKFVLENKKIFKDTYRTSRLSNLFTGEDENEVTLPPAIIGYFERLQTNLGMDNEDFISYVYKEFSEIGLEQRKIKNSYKVAEQRVDKI